jgi:N-acetylglutamate synthase-like GNAT family acetyltransferase
MIRMIKPLECKSDFDLLTGTLMSFLNDSDSFKFLSYSLINFDKETIERITKQHRENGVDYLVSENEGLFSGILAVRRKQSQGFELLLLAVNRTNQKTGIGQSLLNECISLAHEEKYKNIDTLVFADNKNMLRLLIKNDFRPIDIQYHARADGMDLIKLRKCI